MPSVKMKSKSSMDCSREKNSLHVCKRSAVISKSPCSKPRKSSSTAELDMCTHHCDNRDICGRGCEVNEAVSLLDKGDAQFQKQISGCADPTTMGKMDPADNRTPRLESFSSIREPNEIPSEHNNDIDPGNTKCSDLLQWEGGENSDNRSSINNQACNYLDLVKADIISANLPSDGTRPHDDFTELSPLPNYLRAEPSMLFEETMQCMILPYFEEKARDISDVRSDESTAVGGDNHGLHLATHQMQSCSEGSNTTPITEETAEFDVQFMQNLPALSEVVSSFQYNIPPKESHVKKAVTLVLDLDETLVHSTLDHCDSADFTFTVFFDMQEHTVYVKQRPHLHVFLERVAEMFEVVIFTASQSIYASNLLDILDPEGKLISRRVYRESCIFIDGDYTKDLTVLGVDLAKVAIIDNSPQVFRLQVNNGIPIMSWFDDPLDDALISLIPFLETLVDVDDVRPIIAKRFGNSE